MFERFSREAKSAVMEAINEAERHGHDRVGSMHLLSALTLGGDVSAAVLAEAGITHQAVENGLADDSDDAEALGVLGIDLDEVTKAVEASFGEGALSRGQTPRKKHLPMTSGAKKALELSLREAIRLGHKTIGSEHLLLGLVRNGTGSAHSWLVERGTDLDAVRDALVERMKRAS